MDAQELRNLQEAYMEVVENQQLNEEEQSSMPPRRSAAERKKRAKELGDRQTIRGIVTAYNKKRQPSRQEDPEKYYPKEQVDIYDIILSHLLDEGYAETPEAAEAIMVNMSGDWRDNIIDEAYVDYRKGKLSGGRSPQQVLKGKQELNKARAATRANYDLSTPENPAAAKFKARAAKAGKVGKEMDSHTSTAGKIGKALTPGLGNRSGASPRVAYGEPNTDRHQMARYKRGEPSTKG